MTIFEPDDVVWGCNFVRDLYKNGMECTIDSVISSDSTTGQVRYQVRWIDGEEGWVYERNLRKPTPNEIAARQMVFCLAAAMNSSYAKVYQSDCSNAELQKKRPGK
jgi:hypothetical protein